MPDPSDDRARLSDNLACEIAGVGPQKRKSWIKRGLLPPGTRRGLTELEVVELAVLRQLFDALGPHDAKVAWPQIDKDLRELMLLPDLRAVFDAGYRSVVLATSDAEVNSVVSTGRLVRVVVLGPLITEVRAAFRRLATNRPSGGTAQGRPTRRKSA